MDKKVCSAALSLIVTIAVVGGLRAEIVAHSSGGAAGVGAPARAAAVDAPRVVPLQAYLTDGQGRPLAGQHKLTFRLFAQPLGGSPIAGWVENHLNTLVSNGLANVTVGSLTPFPADVAFDQPLFFEIQVDDGALLMPRHQVIAAIFAADADRAEHAAKADHALQADEAIESHQATNAAVALLSESTRFVLDGVHIVPITPSGQYVIPNNGAWHEIPGTAKIVELPAGKALIMYSLGSVWIHNGAGELRLRPSVSHPGTLQPLPGIPVFSTFVHEPPTDIGIQGDQTIATNAIITIPEQGEYLIGLEILTPQTTARCLEGPSGCLNTHILRSIQWSILAFPTAP